MLKAWASPQAAATDLWAEAQERVGRLHAAAAAGARFLLLPVNHTRESALWILASFASPLAVVPCSPALPRALRERIQAQLPGGQTISAEDLPSAGGFPERAHEPKPLEQIWAVIFTSGSSGEPKGVALSGLSLRHSAQAHAQHSQAFGYGWLLDLPLFHIGGFSVLSRAFFLQSPLALAPPRFCLSTTAQWIRSGKVEGISLVTTTLFRLLREKVDFSPLRLALLGGAAFAPELRAEAVGRGLAARLTYGMTEHASQIATETAAGSGMRPLGGTEIQLDGEGEILIRSRSLAAGYFRHGRLEPLPLHEGFFPTGDFGRLTADGLSVSGRKTEMIVSGGLKIFPAEIEAALGRCGGVEDCSVTALPDPEWGEVVCALVQAPAGLVFDPAQAAQSLRVQLDPRKIPKLWGIVDSLPRSAAGKPLRLELRLQAEQLARAKQLIPYVGAEKCPRSRRPKPFQP